MKNILPFFMFLIIYSPKIGGYFDTLSLTCAIVFFIAMLFNAFNKQVLYLFKKAQKYLVYFVIMIIYTFLLIGWNDYEDYYQFLRFGRVFINTLGVLAIVALYIRYYKKDTIRTILFHLWLCIMVHAAIILFMFLVPGLNTFIIDNLVQMDSSDSNYEARIIGYRIGGLTGSWDATSGVQTLGIILLPFIWDKNISKFKKVLLLLTIPLSLFSIAISGATGFLILVIIGVLFLIYKGGLKQKLKFVFLFLVFVSTIFFAVNFLISNNSSLLEDSAVGRTVYMFFQSEGFEGSGKEITAETTFNKIANEMYFLPSDPTTLIFGLGSSGRRMNDYIIEADPGPTLNIHNIGIVATFFIYFVVFKEVYTGFRIKMIHNSVPFYASIILLVILIIDFKVQYLLSRQSLSIMMIALMIKWLYLNRSGAPYTKWDKTV